MLRHNEGGRPLVKVVPVDAKPMRRIGFPQGDLAILVDFDRMGEDEIAKMFG